MSVLCFILLSLSTLLSHPLNTAVMPDCGVATIRVTINGDQLARPVASLGGDDVVEISFDDLSTSSYNYYYKIIHCDAYWRQSSLMSMEYLDGMDGNMLTDYETSGVMPLPYIHYRLAFPNDDVTLTKSGNYAVIIARDNDFEEEIVAVACFSLVEQQMVGVSGDYTANTLKGINGEYQQLEFDVDARLLSPRDVMNDFHIAVYQNGRRDNRVIIDHPTMVQGSTLRYRNLSLLTFEAGNQYRTIDFSSRYTYGSGIDRFVYDDTIYHVLLEPDYIPMSYAWRDYEDAHGAYVVNRQGSGEYSDLEAEYVWVHFTLKNEGIPQIPNIHPSSKFAQINTSLPGIYVVGEMNYNSLDSRSRMLYDATTDSYHLEMFLKQGGINYQYVWLDEEMNTHIRPVEGSFWQTRNRYEVFVYYRSVSDRYDRLVGYQIIEK